LFLNTPLLAAVTIQFPLPWRERVRVRGVIKKGISLRYPFIKIVTARDMNKSQRKMYNKKRGII